MKKTLLSLLCLSATLGASAQLYLPEGAKLPEKATMKLKDHGRIAKAVKPAHKANYNQTEVVADGETMAYGFSKFDLERWSQTYTFWKFCTDKPHNQNMTWLADYFPHKMENWLPEPTAMTFVGDELWTAMNRPFDLGGFYSIGFYNMDMTNGDYSERIRFFAEEAPQIPTDLQKYYDPNAPFILDASYDPTTGLLWYVAPELSGGIFFDGWSRPTAWNFGYVDTKAKKPTFKTFGYGPINKDAQGNPTSIEQFSNIVADHGKLYSVQNVIYNTGEIDPEDGSAIWDVRNRYVCITPDVENETYKQEVLRDYDADELWMTPTDFIGVVIGSALELDRDNRRLYLAYSSIFDGNAYLGELDLNTGRVIENDLQGGGGFSVTTIAMPYQDCKDDAPVNVTGLSVVAGINGANNATISWTNPTGCYFDRKKDPQIQGIRIYRNDELITTCDPDETTFLDFDVPYGTYKYTVVAFNAAGEGLKEARTVFVGRDNPGAPANVYLSANGATGTLTWEAPAIGAHGTWYDKSTLTYDITRLPDNVSVATGLTATTFTEEVKETKGYSYVVTANNHEGVGLSATSNIVTFGPAIEIPYFADFGDVNDFNTWEVVDHNNDGFKWQYAAYTHDQNPLYCALYDATFCGNRPSDYLMSPVLATKAGERYKIEYDVRVHNYKDTEEDFGWYNGNADAYPGNGDLNLFETGHYTSFEGLKWFTRQGIFTADDDQQRIAFSVRSQPLMGILYLKNVNVRHYSDCDLRAAAIEGSAIGSLGRPLPYTVKVKNEGTKTVKKFKIRVYDEEKTSVAEQEFNEAIYSEDTNSFVVTWTPTTAGLTKLYAEVIVDGDTFPYDNITAKPVNLDVSDESDGDWRTIGNNDFYGPNWCAINYPYSISQALYLGEELLLKEGDLINGIGFIYQGMPELASFKNVEFEVSVNNTGLEMIYDWDAMVHDWSYYPYLLKSSYFPNSVFYGFVDLSVTEGEGQLLFTFDEPFTYEGENLLIQVVRPTNSKISADPLLIQMQKRGDSWDENNIGDPNGRAMSKGSDTEVAQGARAVIPGFGDNCLPVLCLGYTDITGIKGIKTLGGKLNINSRRGELELNDVCTNVVVTDLQGRVVARADKAQTISVPASLSGACIVTATLSDGTTISQKAAVK